MESNKVSVLIPARNERYLQKTINDVLTKAAGDVEVIAVLDGYWPDPPVEDHPRVTLIHRSESHGMRDAINSAAAIATGGWLLKTDAHCLFSEGFDEVLKADCDEDWVAVPRRRSLEVGEDGQGWGIKNKEPVDCHYLSYPYLKPNETGMHGIPWHERARKRKDILIDDEMSSQGSCWFMRRKHFRRMGFMQEHGYERFVQEAQEICNKTWLSGGRVVVNKKCFYAHWHKGREVGRGYFIDKREMIRGAKWSARFWTGIGEPGAAPAWPEHKRSFEWLIDKFSPVPTWPADWKEGCRRGAETA
jgi:glycosyltransferase involved in cell wall biosynthesis